MLQSLTRVDFLSARNAAVSSGLQDMRKSVKDLLNIWVFELICENPYMHYLISTKCLSDRTLFGVSTIINHFISLNWQKNVIMDI
jgi:hypothetical protein